MVRSGDCGRIRSRFHCQRRNYELQLRDADLNLLRESFDRRSYLREVEGLADDCIYEIFFVQWWSRSWSITRYENDPHAGPIFPNQPRCFPAIHLRHSKVSKHEVEGAGAHFFNCFLTASRQLHSMTNCKEHLGECLSHGLLIVNYKNAQLRCVIQRRR